MRETHIRLFERIEEGNFLEEKPAPVRNEQDTLALDVSRYRMEIVGGVDQ